MASINLTPKESALITRISKENFSVVPAREFPIFVCENFSKSDSGVFSSLCEKGVCITGGATSSGDCVAFFTPTGVEISEQLSA